MTLSRRIAFSVAAIAVMTLGDAALAPRIASAQVVVEFPSADYLATVDPVYYEGHAAYWWNNQWRWRDGQGWHFYAQEPGYLYNQRSHAPYGRWGYGGATFRGSTGRGGGSFHGGGARGGGGHGGHR